MITYTQVSRFGAYYWKITHGNFYFKMPNVLNGSYFKLKEFYLREKFVFLLILLSCYVALYACFNWLLLRGHLNKNVNRIQKVLRWKL